MPQVRPMLDDIELQHVQHIDVDGDQVLVRHDVPGLEGDFLQRLNRRASHIRLSGVLTGATARDDLKILRDKYRAGDPVSFVADITTATRIGEVLIQELNVRELAGKPARFEYFVMLHEFTLPPPTITETVIQPTEDVQTDVAQEGNDQANEMSAQIFQNIGNLNVEVEIIEGTENVTTLEILVEGTTLDDQEIYLILQEPVDNVFSKPDIPAGTYTVTVFRR